MYMKHDETKNRWPVESSLIYLAISSRLAHRTQLSLSRFSRRHSVAPHGNGRECGCGRSVVATNWQLKYICLGILMTVSHCPLIFR